MNKKVIYLCPNGQWFYDPPQNGDYQVINLPSSWEGLEGETIDRLVQESLDYYPEPGEVPNEPDPAY